MPSVSYMPSDNTTLTVIGMFQDTNSDTAAQFIPVEGTLLPLADGTYLPDQDVYVGEPDFNKFDTKSSQVTLLGEHIFNDTTSVSFTALWRANKGIKITCAAREGRPRLMVIRFTVSP